MTVLEAIQRGTEFLARKNLESPRLQSELLLSHVLAMPRMRLYLNFERVLSEPEKGAIRELLMRRAGREPLQQIVGSTSFCGLEIRINRSVLVPRPETEILAEQGWKYLQERAASCPEMAIRALDFGTGSGCVAVALAKHCERCEVHAIDASADALEVARINAEQQGLARRLQLIHASKLPAPDPVAPYHLVISNPPYIPTAEIETLQPEVRDFEPRSALDGGLDGLDFYRMFAAEAAALLAPGGRLMLEFGDGQGPGIETILEGQKWIVEAVLPDYTGRPRVLKAHRPE